jgi:hypothetical protein
MPESDAIRRIDEYWARRMACSEEELASGSTVIRSFPADPAHRFNVISAHRLGGGCVIIVHDHLHPAIAHLQGAPASAASDERTLTQAYGAERIELAISAAQAYAAAGDLRRPAIDADVRTIDDVRHPAIEALRLTVSEDDWVEASMPEASPPLYAVFAGDEVAAVAHAVERGGLQHIGVVTAPPWRGRGYARAAAYALASTLAGGGHVLEWQARSSNAASLAARDALGFVERYRTINLRVAAASG